MKLIYFYLLIELAFLITGCREGITSINGDPFVGGTYTEIKGNTSGVLMLVNSPFLVIDDIQVLPEDTLIIEPDVKLFIEKDKRIIVEGLIIANGEKDKQIIFQSYYNNTWLGISILNSSERNEFHYCIFQNVDQYRDDPVTYGAVEIQNSNVAFRNCIFIDNSTVSGGGLYSINSNLDITNSIFRNNYTIDFGGAMYLENTKATILNNTFYRNYCTNFGGGIVLNNPAATDIQNNIFFESRSIYPDPHIAMVAGDSLNLSEQYNYLAYGDMNPLFRITDNLHLRLNEDSPCIDEGNPDPSFNDTDGSRNDQGAYGGPKGDW